MRALAAVLAALSLSGCAFLARYGIIPTASGHLEAEPLGCGDLRDPVKRGDISKPIVGAADYHLHQFSNLGFGGRIFWGAPFHEDGVKAAVGTCGVNELCWDDFESVACDKGCRWLFDEAACKAACKDPACSEPAPHGRGGLTEPLSAALREKIGHEVHGYPTFEGWPEPDSYTHQQIYHRWLRRAFDGGLKLIVNLAVSNQVLCELWEHDHKCDDMTNVDLQLAAARKLEEDIDYQNDCEVNGNGWYRIAESPSDARQIIADGAMAVVLGIEVDSLFNCYLPGKKRVAKAVNEHCDAAYLEAQIQKYRELGVRHIFPIHLFDNAFGGTAAQEDFFSFGNLYVNGELVPVAECSKDYSFRYGGLTGMVEEFVAFASNALGFDYESHTKDERYRSLKTHCATSKLSPIGETLINKLIDHKIIIDVDHMSAKSRAQLLEIAKARDMYPGLVSSHTGFTAVNIKNKRHEGQLTPKEVEDMIALGGVFAPELNQGDLDAVRTYKRKAGSTQIEADCGGSSKGFAQDYFYAVDKLSEHRARVIGVGYGSDFNGLVPSPAPRFGAHACEGSRTAEQQDAVEYPIETYEDSSVVFDKSVIGSRAFDINVDGFAHVGMFPDFVADLREIGMTDDDLKPLFSGAEAYIQMWERVEARSYPYPKADAGTPSVVDAGTPSAPE